MNIFAFLISIFSHLSSCLRSLIKGGVEEEEECIQNKQRQGGREEGRERKMEGGEGGRGGTDRPT